MQVRALIEDGLHILQITGEIDLHQSPSLRTVLAEQAEAKCPALLLDFTEVKYIDSSGLATLVEYVQQSSQFGGRFALGGVREKVRTVFDLVRLDEIFPIYATLAEARTALAGSAA